MTNLTQKEQISQLLKNGETIKNIALKTGASIWQIRKYREKNNIFGKSNSVFKSEDDFIKAKNLYLQGTSFKKLAEQFNCSTTGIREALINKGVQNRGNKDVNGNSYNKKHSCNDDYFNLLDSERKAYWLGYLYADGYNDEANYRITIGQSEKDFEIIHHFKKDIEATNPISIRPPRISTKDGVDFQTTAFHSITITSKKLSEDLAKLGCTQKKTFTISFPNIPQDLKRHFIRGYFDGDGSVTNTQDLSKTSAQFNIVGTLEFLQDVQKELIKEGLSETKISPARKNSQIFQLVYGGINNVKAFYNYLYSTCSICLPRKKNVFEEVFEKYESRDIQKDLDETLKAEEIIALFKEGKSYREIEKLTNYSRVTFNDLINKVSNLEILKEELLDKRNKEIIKLHKDGLSARKIEEKLHVSRRVISEILYNEKV